MSASAYITSVTFSKKHKCIKIAINYNDICETHFTLYCFHKKYHTSPTTNRFDNDTWCYICDDFINNHDGLMQPISIYDQIVTICAKCDARFARLFDQHVSNYPMNNMYYDDTLYNESLIAEVNKGLLVMRAIGYLQDVNTIIMRHYLDSIFCVEKLLPFVFRK